jgi:RNA-binding protein 5/10
MLMIKGATAHGVVVTQSDISAFSGFSTTGDSDVSMDGTASQFLILRGLEPGVNEEMLAKGVSKLYRTRSGAPPPDAQATKKSKIVSSSNDTNLGAKEGSLRQVLLIRHRKTEESWRYGFAEFNSVEDAQAAMAKYKASEKFTISSKPVLVSYIHAGVFVPVLHPIGPDSTRFTFSPLSNAAVRLMYWDETAYASELAMESTQSVPTVQLKESEHSKLAAAAANEGLLSAGKEAEPKPKKRKVDKETLASNKKVVAPHLQFWTNRHAELHGLPPKDDQSISGDPLPATQKPNSDVALEPPSRSFADLERKCCLLCSRQFKTEAEVHKHERMSQLHRDNLKNESLVSKASAKLNKGVDSNLESSAYRDRAKERRQAFNQPKQPAAQHNRAKDPGKSGPSKKEDEESSPVPSMGAALLGKMGWTAGEGLGAQGTGRTEAVVAELYSQGVGLGAEGGKLGDAAAEAQRQTKGSYAEFLSKTKDKVKERFERLG